MAHFIITAANTWLLTVIMLSFTSVKLTKGGSTTTFGTNEPASQQQIQAKQASKISLLLSALTYYRENAEFCGCKLRPNH